MSKHKNPQGYQWFENLRNTYPEFCRAVREMAANAYDAGAERVDINFDPPGDFEENQPGDIIVLIDDDGMGMNKKDWWDSFAAFGSDKDPTKESKLGRFPIGMFGIGSFALVPFAQELKIYSRKKGRSKGIEVTIDAPSLLKEPPVDSGSTYFAHIKQHVRIKELTSDEWKNTDYKKKHGTRIVMNGITDETYQELLTGTDRYKGQEKDMFPEEEFTAGVRELAWELSTILPLKYQSDDSKIRATFDSELKGNNPSFEVWLGNQQLHRKIYCKSGGYKKAYSYNEGGVKAEGCFFFNPKYAKDKNRTPAANGIMLRLNNMGIGTYSKFDITAHSATQTRLTGEIHVLEGLHSNVNSPRNGFYGYQWTKFRADISSKADDFINDCYNQDNKKTKADVIRTESERTKRWQKQQGKKTLVVPDDWPVDRVIKSTGELKGVVEGHEIWSLYKNAAEQSVIKAFIRAIEAVGLSDKTKKQIIRHVMIHRKKY